MEKIIQGKLKEIEQQEQVKILYACESGSRAWGFASPDSDWDVRFIYLRPLSWYLSIDLERKRDVIELPIENDLDINGWDLRKALKLFRKYNPALLEWLNTPIIYQEDENLLEQLRQLQRLYFSPRPLWYHYIHMARGNFRSYLHGDQVRLKKYLYVLRPLLAVRWLETKSKPVPIPFIDLVDKIIDQTEVREAIDHLLHIKMQEKEQALGAKIPILNQFIEKELMRHEKVPEQLQAESFPVEPLNALFQTYLLDNA
ncbi:nucleotidyltransferase domain-containing protein [Magnetococcales bacterium HHB-1]